MKKHAELVVSKRRNGRFAVRKRGGGFVNGEAKLKFLVEAGLVKVPTPKKKEEAPAG